MTSVERQAAFEIELPGLPEYASTARLFVSAVARHFGCDDEQVEDLKLAISEAMAFATRAGPDTSPVHVVVRPERTAMVVAVEHDTGFAALMPGEPESQDADVEFGVAVIRSLFPTMRVEPGRSSRASVSFRVSKR